MNKQLLDAIIMEDMASVAQNMIEPARDFTGGQYGYEVDLNKDAIDMDDMLIRIECWMDNILEFDDFSKWVNRILYMHDSHVWDYNVPSILEELGVKVNLNGYLCGSGYTYNDPDYCHLNRDIHYTIFEYDGETYIVFSIHYGADARVGFGSVACFKVEDVFYLFDSMEIKAFYDDNDEDVNVYDLEDIAKYDEESGSWIHNESGRVIRVYSSAEGF